MNFYQISVLFFFLSLSSCNTPNQTKTSGKLQNKGHQIVSKMINKVGDYQSLLDKKDVIYTYTYQTPNGKSDISTEKYLFKNELSYGQYHQHERTLPQFEGEIEQGFDGDFFWLKHKGKVINDQTSLKRVAFNRPTNFYWFTMFQKLLDPSVNYEYLGEKQINETNYDIVKITFNLIGDKPTDIYQLYINKETSLVDQFLFTVADFGKMEIPNIMKLEYEQINDMLIPTKRLYKKSTWNADIDEKPWVKVTWSNIKFNNGLAEKDFKQ